VTTTSEIESGLQAIAERSQHLSDVSQHIADSSQQVADAAVVAEQAVRTTRHTTRWIVLGGIAALVVVLILMKARGRKGGADEED
jgi:hypothetical protein